MLLFFFIASIWGCDGDATLRRQNRAFEAGTCKKSRISIIYLDQSTLRHQGQNRALEAVELLKNQEFQYHFSSVD